MTGRSIALVLLAALLSLAGCGDEGAPATPPPPASPEPIVKGLIFAYGPHKPKNVLDTTHGTFTKDLVLAPSITVPFRLSGDELARISRKILAIDFWSYQSRYVSLGHGQRFEPPAGMRFRTRLTVITQQGSKTVRCSGGFYADDHRAQDLRDLASLITRIIESNPEYKELPPAEGGYV
jgi:hypothetical protein